MLNNVSPIYPLSPMNTLNNSNYEVYESYLSEAIRNKRVKNIAITGDYGIGKSSILKTFCRKTNSNFMFLSLAEYNNVNTSKRQQEQLGFFGAVEDDDNLAEINDRNKFEASLLRQIISLCHRKDIPLTRLKLVPEEKVKKKRLMLTLLLCIDILAILIVSFSDIISEFFHLFLGEQSDLHYLHTALYFMIIIISTFICGRIFYEFISMSKPKEVSASLHDSKAEISATAENEEFCLERYSLELTYIFEMLSKTYDAIVFEDMDRISHKIAIEILTCLREINNTVNERLRANVENKGNIKKFLNICDTLLVDYFSQKWIFSKIARFLNNRNLSTKNKNSKKLCFIFVISEEMISDFDYFKYIIMG